MQKSIHVVGAVIVRDGMVLCAQRGEGMASPGLWEFPGGKVETGESERDALVREIAEELLCSIEVGTHVETTTHGHVVLSTYYATLARGEPQATEHSELRWLAGSALKELAWAPADVSVAHRVADDLSTVAKVSPTDSSPQS